MRRTGRSNPLDPESTFAWARAELGRLPGRAAILFGASVAQRSFDDPAARSDHGEKWRPVLDALWRWTAGDTKAFYDVSRAISEHLVSPFHHCEGQDGPSDADIPCVSATLYTAASMLFGGADGVLLAARIAVDVAMEAAELRTGELLKPVDLGVSDEVQRELGLQVDALRMIAGEAEGLRQGLAPERLLLLLGRR